MDYSLYNKKKSKIPKWKTPNSNVVSSTKVHYSPENLNTVTDSPLMKYLCSKSPITSDSFLSPSNKHQYSSSSSSSSSSEKVMEEDVLVMDGIFIGSGSGSGGGRRVLRSAPDSSGSSSGSGHSAYKLEICRAWEDFRHCRYGSKCQFAHGKEELHPTRFPIKNKSEAQICKTYTSVGSCPYGPKCRFVHQVMREAAAIQLVSPTKPEQTAKSPSTTTKPEHTSRTPTSSINSEHTSKTSSPSTTTKPEHTSKTPTSSINSEHTSKTSSSTTFKPKLVSKSPDTAIEPEDSCKTPASTITSRNWSPLDDGIEVALPSHADKLPSREEIDSHIDNILYGPTRRRRLPVFTQIFPE